MNNQNLFSGKNKKNIINLLPAEFAQRVVKANLYSKHFFNKCHPIFLLISKGY